MTDNQPINIEMYYTLSCPNCKVFERLLKEVLPKYGEAFVLKKTLANGPMGFIKTIKLGIHAVPTVLIDDKIIFKSVPTRIELTETLNQYIK